jgi:hypothetical protein
MKTMNPKKTARIAGILYLIMAPFAIFGNLYGNSLIEPGDALVTANNIKASGTLFELSIVSALIVQIGHIFLVIILYNLLKPVNRNHALLMVIFLLVSVPIAMLSELNRLAILIILNTDYMTVFNIDQLHALVPLFLDMYKYGISFAWMFWGLWLFPMGYLVFKSEFLPRILGILLMIACLGYLIDFVTTIFFPDFGLISFFTSFGEFPLLALWLLIKGVKVEQWEKRALESAQKHSLS